MEKIVIVGAGPAGLFAAYELPDSFDVTVLEQRPTAGGSGLKSDGKLNFHPKIGGNLTEFLPLSKAQKVIDDVERTFRQYGIDDDHYSESNLDELESRANRAGINFVKIKQRHIGSDRLPDVMRKFQDDLERRGVKFSFSTKVTDLICDEGRITEVKTGDRKFESDCVILCPGRSASVELKELYDKLHLGLRFNPIDIGVRVEVPDSITKHIVEELKCWDPKFIIKTYTHGDFVRTFCTCPHGFVVKEGYGNSLVGVNGYSNYEKGSNNTNFAFLVNVGLTEPLEDTTEYGLSIARQTNLLGGGKPIIQTLGDLKRGRRSKLESITGGYIKPTLDLESVVPGDISLAYPHRILQGLMEGLEKLSFVVPGVSADATLLYAPEIKLSAKRIETTTRDGYSTLQTKIPNLFVAGDGAGVSRGIVGAAATGIIAARGIKYLS